MCPSDLSTLKFSPPLNSICHILISARSVILCIYSASPPLSPYVSICVYATSLPLSPSYALDLHHNMHAIPHIYIPLSPPFQLDLSSYESIPHLYHCHSHIIYHTYLFLPLSQIFSYLIQFKSVIISSFYIFGDL